MHIFIPSSVEKRSANHIRKTPKTVKSREKGGPSDDTHDSQFLPERRFSLIYDIPSRQPLDLPSRFLRPRNLYLDKTRQVPVYTLFKRVADKIRPVNATESDGAVPTGYPDWQRVCEEKYFTRYRAADIQTEFDEFLMPRISTIARGARLTPEREEKMLVGKDLLPRERALLRELLFKREGCLAWEWSHMSIIFPEVMPPQRIKTVPHEAWQHPGFRIPMALKGTVEEMLQERLQKGVLEHCDGPYRNPWFLVRKKASGKYRLVNAAMMINKVTIRDANMPPDADEFVEEFAGMAMTSAVDLFSGYDQIALDERDRNMTAIQTPLGLLRQTTLLQGATNSVPQFQRVISWILLSVLAFAKPFMDDIPVKGPRTRYNDEFARPGIRKFVLEHLQNLDKTLYLLELAGARVSAEKSQLAMSGLEIVGWVCDSNGRRPDERKVAKLVNWPVPENRDEVRSFVGLAVYFRILVEGFQIIMIPLYAVLRMDAAFMWGMAEQRAFDEIKAILSTFPAVMPIDYSLIPFIMIVAVDASGKGWGGVLMQKREGVRRVARYESGVWSSAEATYDAGKLECRAVLKTFKKFRHWLYGVHFTLETDANTLVAQLNRPASDLPGALVTRWLTWIRLFDFEVKHVPGTKNGAADGLSRRPATEEERRDQANERDIDDFIAAEISFLKVAVSPVDTMVSVEIPAPTGSANDNDAATAADASTRVLSDTYSDESEQIAKFLTTLRRPPEMSRSQFSTFKKKALKFIVQDGHLFYRGHGRDLIMRRVLDRPEDRERALQGVHTELAHKGREATYNLLAKRYYWPGAYEQTAKFVRCCFECQARDPVRSFEPAERTRPLQLWEKWFIDTTPAPNENGYRSVVQARDSASGWLEARALKETNANRVAQFVWEDIICRHGVPHEIVIDFGPEMRSELRNFLKRYGVHVISISAYHPQANGLIERAMRTLKDALSKMTNGYETDPAQDQGQPSWTSQLSLAVLADRSTLHAHTGVSPFRFVCGIDAVLPIDLEVPTWTSLPWEKVETRADLLAMRAKQISKRDQDVEDAMFRLNRLREQNKEYLDAHRNLRTGPLQKDDLVLLHDTRLEDDLTSKNKLRFRWTGPFRITKDFSNGAYEIAELDGTIYRQMNPDSTAINGSRLKRFHYQALWGDNETVEGEDRIAAENEHLPAARRRRRGRPPRG